MPPSRTKIMPIYALSKGQLLGRLDKQVSFVPQFVPQLRSVGTRQPGHPSRIWLTWSPALNQNQRQHIGSFWESHRARFGWSGRDIAKPSLEPVSDSQNAFNEQVDGWGLVLGIIIYLQIDRSVSAYEFLMGMHIRETGSLTRTGLSPLVGQIGPGDPTLCQFLQVWVRLEIKEFYELI